MLENKSKQSKTSQTPDFIYFLITVYCNDYGKDKRTFDRKDFFKNCFNLPVHGILIVFEKTWPVNNMLYEAKSCTAMFKLCIAEIIWLKGKMFEVTINFFFFFFSFKSIILFYISIYSLSLPMHTYHQPKEWLLQHMLMPVQKFVILIRNSMRGKELTDN